MPPLTSSLRVRTTEMTSSACARGALLVLSGRIRPLCLIHYGWPGPTGPRRRFRSIVRGVRFASAGD